MCDQPAATTTPPGAGAPAPLCEPDPGDELACVDLSQPHPSPTPVAREYPNQLTLSCPSPEEVQRWPRYAVVRYPPGGGRLAPFVHRPHAPQAQQLMSFGAADFEIYLRAAGRPNPQIGDRSTWGPHRSVTLQVSHLTANSSGAMELQFDSTSSTNRWTFDIYNLVAAQPRFEHLIKRTLMAFPIEHLRWGRLRNVFIDFIVGTSRIGVARDRRGRPVLPRVASGGANWPHDHAPADTGGNGTVCVTYSSLNRPWGHHRVRNLPTTDAAIDAAMDDHSETAGTLYHEFGHIFHYLRPGRDPIPASENSRRRAISAGNGAGGLWDRYRIGSGYGGRGGASQGFGEGFAEAYRARLQGFALRGTAAAEAERALDTGGVPTSASARSVHGLIAAYARGQGF